MTFAEFYTRDLRGEIVPACGDRAVIILDGRERLATHCAHASTECKRRGYIAWRICRGSRFTDARAVTSLQHITTETQK